MTARDAVFYLLGLFYGVATTLWIIPMFRGSK